ncbi:MAG: RNA polymerase sigma factor [Gemmatimonadales bacterium]
MLATTAPDSPPSRALEVSIDPTVLAAQRGDDLAFAALYDQHVGRVFALCLRLSADSVLAAELVQDVFVRVWERIGSYRGESAFSTWLHRLAVNTVLDGARQGRRRRLRVAIAADFADVTLLDEPATRDAEPGVGLDLENAVARLPAGARAVFVLYDVEGFSHAEIAAMLGIAEGTSKAHLFRARRLLRGMLDR